MAGTAQAALFMLSHSLGGLPRLFCSSRTPGRKGESQCTSLCRAFACIMFAGISSAKQVTWLSKIIVGEGYSGDRYREEWFSGIIRKGVTTLITNTEIHGVLSSFRKWILDQIRCGQTGLWDEFSLPPVFVNKILWKYNHTHSFIYCRWLFCATLAELSNCYRDRL